MTELITLVTFLLIVGGVFWLARKVARLYRDPVREQLAEQARQPSSANQRRPVGGEFTRSLAAQLPDASAEGDEIGKDLKRAGFYRPTARQEFLAIRNGMFLLVVLIVAIVAVAIGPQRENTVLRVLGGGAVAALLAWSVPRVLLALKAKSRVNRICRSLPDGLDMVSMCLAGGLSLEDSLASVNPQIFDSHADLAVELTLVRQHAKMSSLEFAIQKFAERIDASETIAMSALITQNQQLGVSVAESMREYADSMRTTQRLSAEEKTSKLQVRLLFPIVCCFLPGVILLLWGPGLLEMWDWMQQLKQP